MFAYPLKAKVLIFSAAKSPCKINRLSLSASIFLSGGPIPYVQGLMYCQHIVNYLGFPLYKYTHF